METEQTTISNNRSNNCKMNCKCILTIVAITLLAASSSYLFIRQNSQMEVIKTQENYINELRANLSWNNSGNNLGSDFNGHLNRLFN